MHHLFHKNIFALAALVAPAFIAVAPALADQTVAQDGTAAHTLLYSSDEPGPIELGPGEGLFEGMFASHDPGWASLDVDMPPDAYTLLPGHQVSLQRISFAPGFGMYFPFTGAAILASDGAIYTFNAQANGSFDNDLIYAADGPVGATYSATFRLVDPSGIHAASEPFTLDFVVVPEPAAAGLLGLGWLFWRIKRRK